jgi:hypothetical protein
MFPATSRRAVYETATCVSRTLNPRRLNHQSGAGGTNASGGICRPVAPCPSGWIPYNDTACSPPIPDGGIHCSSNGDGLCYLACSTSTDCRAMGLNSCGSITFFHNNDYGTQVAVCDGTAQLPACSTPDAGSDDGG